MRNFTIHSCVINRGPGGAPGCPWRRRMGACARPQHAECPWDHDDRLLRQSKLDAIFDRPESADLVDIFDAARGFGGEA